LLRRLLSARRIRDAVFVYAPALTHELSYQRSYEERDAVLQKAIKTDVLVLDDLGATRIAEFERDHILMLLHQRHADNKSVLVTTNESISRLVDLVGERIVSRVQQSQINVIDGKDRRGEGT
jgi:DNA replication protein DnaC